MKCKVCGAVNPKKYNKQYQICDKCYMAARKLMRKEKGYFFSDDIPEYIPKLRKRLKELQKPIRCIICGKEFVRKTQNQKTCSKECSAIHTKQLQNENFKRYKAERRKKWST